MKKLTAVIYVALLGLTSCASILNPRTVQDVPTIDVAKVKAPALKNIPGRTVSLSVMDNRDNRFKANTAEMTAELTRAVTEILKKDGIAVNPSSKNSFLISAQDFQTAEYKDSCIKLNGMLSIPQVANLYSDATSCFAVKSPFSNMTVGSDINESYEMALTTVFEQLGTNLQKLVPPKK